MNKVLSCRTFGSTIQKASDGTDDNKCWLHIMREGIFNLAIDNIEDPKALRSAQETITEASYQFIQPIEASIIHGNSR